MDAGTLTGAEVSLSTAVGDIVLMGPDGASYDSILAELAVPLSGDE
jgi:ribose 1,5-bisphosphokinase PhnN